MNTFLDLVILSVLQGLTEFLPISSSGHLVLAKTFLKFDSGNSPLVELVLHAGTLVAILVHYRARIWQITRGLLQGNDPRQKSYARLLVIGFLPAVLAYLAAGKYLERLFSLPRVAAGSLVLTGLFLLSTLFIRRNVEKEGGVVTWGTALATGLVQAFALIPGISRSGATIVTARHLGVDYENAAEFSFLTALPLFVGAAILAGLELWRGNGIEGVSIPMLTSGFAVSAVTGLLAIRLLLWAMSRRLLPVFGLYCLLAGMTVLCLL